MDYAQVYGELHSNLKRFPGYSVGEHYERIKDLIEQVRPSSLLDYGCGKGYQYLARRVHEKWGGLLPHCYDIGVTQLSRKPEGRFGGVICTDMLEHVEEADVEAILGDIFGYAEAFVFLAISVVPSKKRPLPDGRNIHLTVKPPEWWLEKIQPFRREGLIVDVVFDESD